MSRRTACAALLAAVLLLLVAGPASAHAVLEASTPGQGALLKTPPPDVVLRFDEPITYLPTSLRVFAPDGSRADNGIVAHDGTDPSTLEVGFGGTEKGTYLVSWRVISADSHPVSGAFTFSVGRAGKAPTASELTNNPVVAGLLGVARWAGYAGSALLLGGLAFAVLCWRRAWDARAFRRVLLTGGIVLALSAVVLVLAKGALDAGLGLSAFGRPSLVREVLGTAYGKATVVRGLVGLAGMALALAAGVIGRLPRSWQAAKLVVLSVVAAGSFAFAGHAEASSPRWLALLADGVHVLAMSMWLGGLVVLVIALRAAPDREAIARRFSWVGLSCVGVLVVSGVYQGWYEVRAWGALTGTPYGRELIIKLVLVAAVVAVAAASRQMLWRAGPKGVDGVARLGRTVAIEAVGILAILGVTSVLVASQPAYSAYHPVVSANLTVSGDLVQVSAVPAGDRTMDLHLYVFRDSRPSDPKAITATVTLPSQGVGPLPVRLSVAGPGHRIGTIAVPITGDWQLAVTVRTSAIDEATGYVTVPIH